MKKRRSAGIKRKLREVYSAQRELSLLGSAAALLSWDQRTFMPKGASGDRAEQEAFMSGLMHEKFVDPKLFKAVREIRASRDFCRLGRTDRIMILRLEKEMKKARKLPKAFVEELSRVESRAYIAWEEAKKKSDFSLFAPHLEKVVRLKRKEAKLFCFPGHPYNSLLDDYEEGMTVERIKPVFEYLEKELSAMIRKIVASRQYKAQRHLRLRGTFPQEAQERLARGIWLSLGSTELFSRMDRSAHPFSTDISANDVRITTRYEEDNPLSSFFSSVHETGHELHDMGLPKKLEHTVLFSSPSCGLSESQSRFWENNIARSREFWVTELPKFKKEFPDLKQWSAGEWHRLVNRVEQTLIRTESDEVTYGLHVIMRFRLELGLIEGSLKVADLPKKWGAMMKELLGVAPSNDREGVLQDVHWSEGAFGYFPSYVIGNIYASQLFDAVSRKSPGAVRAAGRGDYSKILAWLRKNVHSKGSTMTADEVVRKACGRGLDPKVYVDYLKAKYSAIYGVKL